MSAQPSVSATPMLKVTRTTPSVVRTGVPATAARIPSATSEAGRGIGGLAETDQQQQRVDEPDGQVRELVQRLGRLAGGPRRLGAPAGSGGPGGQKEQALGQGPEDVRPAHPVVGTGEREPGVG